MSRARTNESPSQQAQREQEYRDCARSHRPAVPYVAHMLSAFLVGGAICLVGQVVLNAARGVEGSREEVAAVTQAAMILLGAILTDVGIYDDIGEFGGMGAAVPITGFSNTIVAAAIDFRREGWLAGLGSKMFVVAGPVLVYGIVSGVAVGALKLCFTTIWG